MLFRSLSPSHLTFTSHLHLSPSPLTFTSHLHLSPSPSPSPSPFTFHLSPFTFHLSPFISHLHSPFHFLLSIFLSVSLFPFPFRFRFRFRFPFYLSPLSPLSPPFSSHFAVGEMRIPIKRYFGILDRLESAGNTKKTI